MLELKLTCETADELRVYLNAQEYHNLLSDFLEAVRTAKKYGDAAAVLKAVDRFLPDMYSAVEHHTGAY